MRPNTPPPGWPTAVPPPPQEGWQRSAVSWLLEQLPPELRGHPLLRLNPPVLAFATRVLVGGYLDGLRRGYATARSELGGRVEPPVVEDAMRLYEQEGRRVLAVERAVELVEEALAGTRLRRGHPQPRPPGEPPTDRPP